MESAFRSSLVLDRDGTILHIAPDLTERLGGGSEGWIGRALGECVADPGVQDRLLARSSEDAEPLKTTWTTSDGRSLPVALVPVPGSRSGRDDIECEVHLEDGALPAEPFADLTRIALERSADALFWIDRGGRLRFVNEATCRSLGYTRDELLARNVWDFVSDLSPEAWPDRWVSIRRAGYREYDSHQRRKDGVIVPTRVFASYVEGGGQEYVCAFVRDITEGLLAEEQLRLTQFAIENSVDGAYWLGPDGRFFYVNEAACRAVGYSRKELLELAVPDINPQFPMDAWPAHWERIKRAGSLTFESQHKTKDGRVFPIEIASNYQQFGDHEFICSSVRDITTRKQIEHALRGSERRFRALYDDIPSMFFTVEPEGTILSANHFGASHLGYRVEELIGQPVSRLHLEGEADDVREYLAPYLLEGETMHRREVRKVHKDGSTMWVRETARLVEDQAGKSILLMVCEDITEAHELSEQLSYQASHDGLTGLVNRSEFERRLERVLQDTGPGEHALCYMDLDQFKVINDTCGHVAGDELLRQLGELLRTRVRRRDTLARLGGDEFGVLMEHCNLDQAQRVADTLRAAVEQFRFAWESNNFSIAVSMGLVPLNSTSGGINDVLSAADSACYKAKDEGRNRVHVYRVDDVELARRYGEMQWVPRINQALEEGRLQLLYQPIAPIHAPRDEGHHYELLVRMIDEGGQAVPPGAFLPAAERYNLSTKIDRWVIDHAFQWLSLRPRHLDELFLCTINLSGHSLGDEELLDFVIRRLDGLDLPPEKICFEITESAAITNLSNATRLIRALKGWGSRFALDDFGSGLSSFAYLRNLEVDFLKIDGLFVKDIPHDPIDMEMVRSINEIGHVLGKQTIAEFVENDDILERLRDIGVDYAQGYGIGVPMPLESLDTQGVLNVAQAHPSVVDHASASNNIKSAL